MTSSAHLFQPAPDVTAADNVLEHTAGLGYASQRWRQIIAAVLQSETDVKTLDAWAHEAGLSASAIRAWCRIAGLSAKRSLDFARLLRVILRNEGCPLRPFELLDVVDDRTMRRLLAAGGITPAGTGQWPVVEAYLRRQTFVRDFALVRSITELCSMLSRSSASAAVRQQ
jgi:hypothetical protein